MLNIHKHTCNNLTLALLLAHPVEDNSLSSRNPRNPSGVGAHVAMMGTTTTICLQDLPDASTLAHDYCLECTLLCYHPSVRIVCSLLHTRPVSNWTRGHRFEPVTSIRLSKSAQPRLAPRVTIKADQLASQHPQAGPERSVRAPTRNSIYYNRNVCI